MSSPGHEDHSDLDSLFGDDESHDEYSSETPQCQQRSVIQLPRAAVVSQNVGTIAHSSVPSSTEHPPSSGHMSSASIPLISNTVSGPLNRSKRNASPGFGQPSKKRRVDSDTTKPSDKPSLGNLGVVIAPGQSLTSTKLQSVVSLLAPSTTPSRGISRGSKGKSNITHNVATQAPVVSGTGTATDPVIIPDESSTFSMPSQSATSTPQTSNRRVNRSQQARLLLEALPNDPSDLLSQTLRTILKNPTTAPCGRSTVPRDTAVYLANGRLTGTPFLRLLRHLAGPTRQTEPAVGLALLKKLVEAMRATEEMISKAASAGQSSAASTPMPTTPGTPSTTSFPSHDTSGIPSSSKQLSESNLFSQFDFPPVVGLDSFSLPPIAEFDSAAQADIAIDPELLALSQDPAYLQTNSQNLPDLDFDLAELFGALPASASAWPASPVLVPGIEPGPADPAASWGDLTNLPLDDLLKGWLSSDQSPSRCEPQLSATVNTTAQTFDQPTLPAFGQPPNTTNSAPRARRIPAKAEAQALLERARAHKKELETKIAAAKRQLWGCKIEAGVERNLLDKLKK